MLINDWVRLSFINVGVCRGSKGRLGRNQGSLKGTNLTARRKTILHDKLVELSKLIPYLEWSQQVFWLVKCQHYLFTLAVAMMKWTTWRRCVFVCCPRLSVCSILLVRVNRILHPPRVECCSYSEETHEHWELYLVWLVDSNLHYSTALSIN